MNSGYSGITLEWPGATTVAAWYLAIFTGSMTAGVIGSWYSRLHPPLFFFTLTGVASIAAGMLLALQDINKAGKISFVGFDSSQTFIDAINANQLHGIVVQNPFNMGYLGVRTMVDSLLGKPVEKKIDTGGMLVTKENLQTPDVNALLHPPLDQYLK